MPSPIRLRQLLPYAILGMATVASVAFAQQPAPKSPLSNGNVTIRGCLTGNKLVHIEPDDATLKVPDVLRVTSIRVIKSQVKGLDGHQVEVIGTLRGIPDQDDGILISNSPKAKVYIGGQDKSLGNDAGERVEPPTIHANTIKDIAEKCPFAAAK